MKSKRGDLSAKRIRSEPKQPEDFDFRDKDLSQSRKNAGLDPEPVSPGAEAQVSIGSEAAVERRPSTKAFR